jgi:hypothetical protein
MYITGCGEFAVMIRVRHYEILLIEIIVTLSKHLKLAATEVHCNDMKMSLL